VKKPNLKKPKVEVYKPKRRRVGINARSVNHTCPNCLSTLTLTEQGQWKCTGNKLKLWSKQFEEYEKMNVIQKQKYLNTLDNQDKFLEWFNQKDKLVCDWLSRSATVEPTYSTTIPDPMAVNKIEKKLGRELTEEELEEGFVFYRKLIYNEYFYSLTKVDKDWTSYILPRVNFPDDI
jgi:hypothetical protein